MTSRSPMLVAALLMFTGACVPAVAHGPRIEPGWSVGASASYTDGPSYDDYTDGPDRFLYGPIGANVGYAWSSGQPDRAAYRLGLHVPVPLFMIAQPDVYVQLPRTMVGGLDAGVGVSGWLIDPLNVHMPYVQLGRISDAGTGWYTTQGWFRNDQNRDIQERHVRESQAWVPTIAYQWGHPRHTLHAFATGVFGTRALRCMGTSGAVCEHATRWSAAAGVTVELHRRRATPAAGAP